MQKELDEEELNQEDDWGNPPSPDTPENRKKALRAQIILGIFIYFPVLRVAKPSTLRIKFWEP